MKIKQCSLFSGIGAFEKALKNNGVDFEITSFCEIDKYASCAYSAIHGVSEELNLGDISKVDTKDIPEFNLLTWGFPCQDISIAGKQAGIKVGTRSGLYYEGYRILKDRLPKYSIIENVKNLTSKKHIDKFHMILNDLSELGYKNYWGILNAKDFGVPQNRERVFIVSILGDGDFEMPVGKDSGVRLKDILETEVDEKYYINKPFKIVNKKNVKAECYKENFDQNKRVYGVDGCFQCLSAKDRGTNKILVKAWIDNNSTYKETNKILDENGVCTTLTTMKGGRREPKVVEDFRIRKLTPLECWRLMGFDDEDFYKAKKSICDKFYKGKDRSNSQMYKMAGNSIVVNVPMAIFKKFLSSQN